MSILYFSILAACADATCVPDPYGIPNLVQIEPTQYSIDHTDLIPGYSYVTRFRNDSPVVPYDLVVRIVDKMLSCVRSVGQNPVVVTGIDLHGVLTDTFEIGVPTRNYFRAQYESRIASLNPRQRALFNVLRSHFRPLHFCRPMLRAREIVVYLGRTSLLSFLISSMDSDILDRPDCYTHRQVLFGLLGYDKDTFKVPREENFLDKLD